MYRILSLALLALLSLSGVSYAQSGIGSLPAATVPLDGIDVMWLNQGSGCAANTTPCTATKAQSTRLGQPLQTTCSSISSPFLYQSCVDTSTSPPTAKIWFDGIWNALGNYDTANGGWVPPIGGGKLLTVASSGTTDLCSVAGSVVYVSGSASITSFGNTCPQGVSKMVIWNATPTIVYNASTMILPGATNITPKPGDVWFLTEIASGAWQLFFEQPASSFSGVTSFNGRTGVVNPQTGDYSFNQLSGSATNTQLPTTGAVGSSIGMAGTLAVPNTSVVIQASSINVATTLNGTTYSIGNYSVAFNGATVGAGGMDTGAIPTSGNLCLYAIYNPTSVTSSILGVNCTTSSGTIYSGAHMPGGFTASAFLISWPTNGTPALVAGTISTPAPALAPTVTALPGAPIGNVINPTGTLGAPNTAITLGADTVVVGTTLTGTSYTLGSYSGTFNSGGTGAGGMDVGALPSSGNVCIYVIYNPATVTSSLLGVNCVTSSGTIYGGSHMPSGYTASALLAHWPTNSSPAMVAGNICNWSNGTVTSGGAYSTGGCGVSSFNGASGAITFNIVTTPQGRLTLTSATPVMTATVSGATTIFYTPYVGNTVPVWNGTTWTMLGCSELSNITSNSAVGNAGPAPIAVSSNYDLFVWSNAGVCTLTRAAVWTTNTARANALVYQNGILVNNSSITNGPGATFGTYVGTVHSNGASTIDYIFGAAASGGTACSLQVWNEYNRVNTACVVTDSGAPYTYSSATIRQARASAGNQGSFVLGEQEDVIQGQYAQNTTNAAAAGAISTWGMGLDTTSAYSCTSVINFGNTTILSASASCALIVGIGNHVISANEQSDGVNLNTVDGANTFTKPPLLSFSLRN